MSRVYKTFAGARREEVARRMLASAVQYSDGADKLRQCMGDFGTSSIVLQILAFEILLKCLVVLEAGYRVGSHDYSRIWEDHLGEATRSSLISSASARSAGHVDFSDVRSLLLSWQRAFEHGRYDYESNEDLSDYELSEKVQKWIDLGAPIDEADFIYCPEELYALCFALHEAASVHLNRETPA